MKGLFNFDSPVMRVMTGVADLAALNVIWLICCIPVVTIGPACVAMCYVVRHIAEGETLPVLRTFFRAFRDNFRQGLVVFLILLAPLCLAALYAWLAFTGALAQRPALKYLSYFAIIIICSACSYAYPLLAHFNNTTKNTLKNAFLLPLFNPLLALIVTGLNLLPVVLFLIDAKLVLLYGVFWLVGGCALTAFINEKLLCRMFNRYIPSDPPAME